MKDAVLVDVLRYPVKGFSGHRLSSAALTRGQGLPLDRAYAITNGMVDVTEDGAWTPCQAFQRLTKNTTLSTFALAVDAEHGHVTLTHADGTSASVQGASGDGTDAAHAQLASWFPPERQAPPRWVQSRGGTGYWDHHDAALSIINLDSVEALAAAAGVAIDPLRFRGNLHVRGAGAWSELAWLGRRLRVGTAEVEVTRPIDRCSAPSVNPSSGVVDVNVLALLARHSGHAFCGVYARVVKSGAIAPNDTVIDLGPAAEALKASSTVATAPPRAAWPRQGRVMGVADESDTVRSFWISDPLAHAGVAPPFTPGQHLRLHGVGPDGTRWRAYTISAIDHAGAYRISVQRDDQGSVSSWLHNTVKLGDAINFSGPIGHFVLPDDDSQPLAMFSAGIGITPLLAMLQGLAKTQPGRRVHWLHVARDRQSLALWQEVQALLPRMPHLQTTLHLRSDHAASPVHWATAMAGWHPGDVRVLLCGPPRFMTEARERLRLLGVQDTSLHQEVFASPVMVSASAGAAPMAGPFNVTFQQSKVEGAWVPATGSLLDLAESLGVKVPSHCRGGVCGTCSLRTLSGDVAYTTDPVGVRRQGHHLMCCTVPTTPLVVDA
jgi:ferredoxin-NADP reductase/uncharacterized protein YcbX